MSASAGTITRPNLLSILRERNLALLWMGQAISNLGDGLFNIALIWLVLQLTGSALAMGTTIILTQLPRLAFQLIGGVSVDRYDRRSLMLWSDMIRALVVLSFAALVATNQIQLIHVYVLAITFGIVAAFFYPAQQALIPNLVPANALIPANSLMNLTQQLSQIIGPALAGVLIAMPAVGIAGVAFFDSASFAAGALGLALMRVNGQTDSARKASSTFWGELGDGIRYLLGFRALVIILLLAMVLNFALAPFQVILPILAKTILGQGSEGFGLLMAAMGVGAIIGSLTIGAFPPRTRRGIFAFALVALVGALFAALGISATFAISLALLAAGGFLLAVANTTLAAVMQGLITDEYRGRVFGFSAMISNGLTPIAMGLGGILADTLGAGNVFVLGGAMTMVVSLSGFLFREIRELQ